MLALTGSQGKTGTKDYLAQVLGTAGPTVATAGNFNNEIGVPLTVLRADAERRRTSWSRWAPAASATSPTCAGSRRRGRRGLNVGTAHLGEFGSREAIAVAKGELVEALPGRRRRPCSTPTTRLVRRDGDAHHRPGDDVRRGRATSRWRNVELDDLGRPSFELGYAGTWRPVRLTQTGRHQVANAAAAAAMALAVGIAAGAVADALGAARSSLARGGWS